MKTKPKLYKAPPPQSVRRRDGTKLSLHVKRDRRGMAEPYRMIDGEPHWRFVYRHRSGPGGSRTFPATDWTDAQKQAVKLAEEFDHPPDPTAVEAKPVPPTMSALIAKLKEQVNDPDAKCNSRSARGYSKQIEQHIAPYFVGNLGDPPVTVITSEHVDEWKRQYLPAEELKDETRRKLVSLLDRLFKLAVEYGWRAGTPVLKKHHVLVAKLGEQKGKRLGDQREGVYIEPAKVKAIVTKTADLRPNDLAAPMTILLAARCGFRREELVHLRREDVIVTDDCMIIWRRPVDCDCRICKADRSGRYHGKTSAATRPVVVPPELRHEFVAYLKGRDAQFGAGKGWLLPAWPAGRARNHVPSGGQRLLDWAPDDFNAACAEDALSLPGLVFHDTRHTAITDLQMRASREVAVKYVVGHAGNGITARYTHLGQVDLAALYRDCFPDWAAAQPAMKLAQKTA